MFRFTASNGRVIDCSDSMELGDILPANQFNAHRKGIKVFQIPMDKLETTSIAVIVLGINCNTNCSYCFQREYARNHPEYNISFTPDLIDSFMEKFKTNLLESLDGHKSIPIKEIVFWGGEPLVYWKTIKGLVPKLKSEIPTLEYFSLSTNGTLLDTEKLEFMNKWDIQLQLSDDGNTNSFRGVKVENTMSSIRRLVTGFCKTHPNFRLHVHSTFNNKNCNIETITDSLLKIYGSFAKRIMVIPPYMPTSSLEGTLKEEFTKDQLKEVFASTLKAYRKHYNWFKAHDKCNRVDRALDYIAGRGLEAIPENGVCASSVGSIITVDGFGNLYVCRDAPFKEYRIGNFKTKYSFNPYYFGRDLNRMFSSMGSSIAHNLNCRDCELRAFCGGMCSLMNAQKKNVLCPVHWVHSMAIITATIEKECHTTIADIQQDRDNPLVDLIKDCL